MIEPLLWYSAEDSQEQLQKKMIRSEPIADGLPD